MIKVYHITLSKAPLCFRVSIEHKYLIRHWFSKMNQNLNLTPLFFENIKSLRNLQKFYDYKGLILIVFNCSWSTLRSLINVQSLITVQGVTLFYKSLKSARALGFSHSLGPRDSKKSKFIHLNIYLVVLEQLTGL